MLEITFKTEEQFNEETGEFVPGKKVNLKLEHSLVSLAKWESKWCKPFLGNDKDRKQEEALDYIRCMTITQNVDPSVYAELPRDILKKINEYIASPSTGAIIKEKKTNSSSSEIVTSDLIYYWMVAHNIPFECQKWHLNRLLTLIRICSIKNSGDKNKMSKQDTAAYNRELNRQRRAARNTRG